MRIKLIPGMMTTYTAEMIGGNTFITDYNSVYTYRMMQDKQYLIPSVYSNAINNICTEAYANLIQYKLQKKTKKMKEIDGAASKLAVELDEAIFETLKKNAENVQSIINASPTLMLYLATYAAITVLKAIVEDGTKDSEIVSELIGFMTSFNKVLTAEENQ